MAGEGTRFTINAFHIVFVSDTYIWLSQILSWRNLWEACGPAPGLYNVLQHNLSGQPAPHTLGVYEQKLHNYHISFQMGISSLTNDVSVCYTNCHPVFGCVVFIFILDYRAFPEISFTLSSSCKSHLVFLEVGLIFDNVNKPHPVDKRPVSAALVQHSSSGSEGKYNTFYLCYITVLCSNLLGKWYSQSKVNNISLFHIHKNNQIIHCKDLCKHLYKQDYINWKR